MQVDIKKTIDYYISYNDICKCDACQNYIKTVIEEYPKLHEYLCSIGVDIYKPLEIFWLENHHNHTIYYEGVQYAVIGKWENDFFFQFASHSIFKAANHLSTGIKEEHFVIDISDIILHWKFYPRLEKYFLEFDKERMQEEYKTFTK